MKYKTLVLVTFLVGALSSGAWAESAESDEQAAESAANKWLALVDHSQYKQSWSEAAVFFKTNVPQNKWVAQVKGVRSPLGKMLERKLKSEQATKSLPGAPDGDYVVIQYDTKFAQKSSAIETITPMKDKDGKWHVSGYFIR